MKYLPHFFAIMAFLWAVGVAVMLERADKDALVMCGGVITLCLGVILAAAVLDYAEGRE